MIGRVHLITSTDFFSGGSVISYKINKLIQKIYSRESVMTIHNGITYRNMKDDSSVTALQQSTGLNNILGVPCTYSSQITI